MNLGGLLRSVRAAAVKNSPAIFTGLGIVGFGTAIVMTAKASPKAAEVHEVESGERSYIADDVASGDVDPAVGEDLRKKSYIREGKQMAMLYGPVALVGAASVGCILMSNRIRSDRQAALMAAYSLSTETLSRYQDKVVEKLGEEVHTDILGETAKEMARDHADEDADHEKTVVPAGTVRVYDNVTGRYFFSSRERILEAESEINKRLINEIRIPLQDFYYELGLEDKFTLGDSVGWDVSNPYYNAGNMDIFFTPMLDDEKNPCLALNYHVTVFERQV